MSSTNERQLRKFFDKKLAPAARKLRDRDVRFFARSPADPGEDWYVDVSGGLPEFIELDDADAERELRAMWEQQDLPELAKLAKDLMKLAREIEIEEEQSADVSPFVYVMY
jgi:hypothetical protein